MTVKRIAFILVAVAVMVAALPLTAGAVAVNHPITNWGSVTWFPTRPESEMGVIIPDDFSYDWVAALYFVNAGVPTYYVFLVKGGKPTVNAKNECIFTSDSIVYKVEVIDKPNATLAYQRRCFDYYPQSIGYYYTGISGLIAYGNTYEWLIVESSKFPFKRIPDPALKPPDPPPPPEVPPMVIPPHNPEMIPWTESKMDDFFTYVSNATGHIVNIGIAFFGLILAVYVAIRIIRTFERVSGEGG